MTKRIVRAALAAWLVFCAPVPLLAQEATLPGAQALDLMGSGLTALRLTPAILATLSRLEQEVSFRTAKGERHGRNGGVLLWKLMERAGIAALPGRHAELQRTFVVTGRDGYAIAFSVGEISPDFGNRPVMVADHLDGKPLPAGEGLRLIVPGEKRGARNVRDLATVETC